MSPAGAPDHDVGSFTLDPDRLIDGRVPVDQREEEWVRVFRHFQPRLQRYFGSRTASAEALDDLLGDLWRRAVLGIGSLRSGAAMWTWLITIGNNLLRDQWRREHRSPIRELSWSDAEADDRLRAILEGWAGPESIDSSGDDQRTALLEKLTEEDRALLTLFADGFTHEEIAVELGLSGAAASRQRLRRLRLRVTGATADTDDSGTVPRA